MSPPQASSCRPSVLLCKWNAQRLGWRAAIFTVTTWGQQRAIYLTTDICTLSHTQTPPPSTLLLSCWEDYSDAWRQFRTDKRNHIPSMSQLMLGKNPSSSRRPAQQVYTCGDKGTKHVQWSTWRKFKCQAVKRKAGRKRYCSQFQHSNQEITIDACIRKGFYKCSHVFIHI